MVILYNYSRMFMPTGSNCIRTELFTAYEKTVGTVLRGSLAVGRCTCDLQVADSIPGRPLSRNIDQLSLASLRGR